MRDLLLEKVKNFLRQHVQSGKPILLGYSGGSDSSVLLDLLIACAKDFPLELHLAHVNHNWRKESTLEAEALRKQADSLGLPFHLYTSQEQVKTEEAAREERTAFFLNLFRTHGYQALMLAHQAQDQSETVLKRIFEGASLFHLEAMQPITYYKEMPIWRPLLNISKEVLKKRLVQNKINFINDYTNQDLKYLRARMRQKIIPELCSHFGKQVDSSLLRIAGDAHLLHDYLDRKTKPLWQELTQGPLGWYWDLRSFSPLEALEISFVLKKFLSTQGVIPSAYQLSTMATLLIEKKANLHFPFTQGVLWIDRGQLFWCTSPLPQFCFEGQLESQVVYNDRWQWQIECSEQDIDETASYSDWRSLWKGKFYLRLPRGSYRLIPADQNKPYPRSSLLKKWWNDHKVPAFLWKSLPLIAQENHIISEFLSGKDFFKRDTLSLFVAIELKNRDQNL